MLIYDVQSKYLSLGQISFEDILVGISKCSMVIFDYAAVKMFINVFWNKEANSNLQTMHKIWLTL